jgi:8-oxo-dGTP diphosphatase
VYSYKYPRPSVTVDVVVLCPSSWSVLLVTRGGEPFRGQCALPGGFLNTSDDCDQGEFLADGARRELLEETGIRAYALEQIGAFGTPGRDPRGRVISVAFLAVLDGEVAPTAGDDAASAAWVELDVAKKMRLAFDHNEILAAGIDQLSERSY